MSKPPEKNKDREDPFYKINVVLPNPWVILGIFTLFYIGLSFFTMAGQEFFVTHIVKSENVGWSSYLVTSAIIFGILFFIIKYSDMSIIEFEHSVL